MLLNLQGQSLVSVVPIQYFPPLVQAVTKYSRLCVPLVQAVVFPSVKRDFLSRFLLLVSVVPIQCSPLVRLSVQPFGLCDGAKGMGTTDPDYIRPQVT